MGGRGAVAVLLGWLQRHVRAGGRGGWMSGRAGGRAGMRSFVGVPASVGCRVGNHLVPFLLSDYIMIRSNLKPTLSLALSRSPSLTHTP